MASTDGKTVSVRKYCVRVAEVEQPWGNEVKAVVYDDNNIEIVGLSTTVEKILRKSDDEILDSIKEKVKVFNKIHTASTRGDLIKDIMFDVLMLLIKLTKKDSFGKVEEEDITDELLVREGETDTQKS